MLRIISVSLLLSSVGALRMTNIPIARSADSVKFRELSHSRTETKFPWSVSDDSLAPKLVANNKKRTIEVLKNQGDGAGYLGTVWIGKQPLTTIWDTGSDTQVVNSVMTVNLVKPCFTAPEHCYDKQKSSTYKMLSPVPRVVSYGSGDTFVLLGTEKIGNAIGEVDDMPFYELETTNIPNILQHDIDVVGGLGPRGWTGATLTKALGVDRFSFCFPKDNKKDGFLIWNDNVPPAHFNTMAVSGATPTFWGLPMTELALSSPGSGHSPLDFKGECIVDTGTSLITLDKKALDSVQSHLDQFSDTHKGLECNDANLNKFPDITFNLAGKPHRFKPSDYIMYTEGESVPDEIAPFVSAFNSFGQAIGSPFQIAGESKKQCVMMFTPPMEDGTCILGMPFMRNYYTTFDRTDRSVHTMLHDGNCNMGVAKAATGPSFHQKLNTAASTETTTREPMTLRKIDLSKLKFSTGFMNLWSKHQAAQKAIEKTVDKVVGRKKGLQLHEKVKA